MPLDSALNYKKFVLEVAVGPPRPTFSDSFALVEFKRSLAEAGFFFVLFLVFSSEKLPELRLISLVQVFAPF